MVVAPMGAVIYDLGEWTPPGACGPGEPTPRTSTPIHHLFVIIQENHAFENYFGDFPGAIGYPPTGELPVAFGSSETVAPFALPGTSTPDLPHDRASALADWGGGRNDGFVAQANLSGAVSPTDAVGYYTAAQVGGYWALARNYSLGDRFFSGVLGPTQPNRVFDITAFAGDGWYTDAAPPANVTSHRTILDQLGAAGVPWAYDYAGPRADLAPFYFPSLVGDACSRSRMLPLTELPVQLWSAGTPAVVFLDNSNDRLLSEHPPANVTLGEDWALQTIRTIQDSPVGPSSAILLFYDENGGYWDPVTPPMTPTGVDGFRVPFLAISPWTPGGTVCSVSLDPASVLNFVDSNWGLPPLNDRVAGAPGLSCFFNFLSPPRSAVTAA